LVAAMVDIIAEFGIGIDGVEAAVLVSVGTHLRADTGAPSLLVEIEKHAAARGLHGGETIAQLVAAVALERAAQIAGDAGGMYANRDRARQIWIADDDGDLVLLGYPPAENHEMGVAQVSQRHARPDNHLEILA